MVIKEFSAQPITKSAQAAKPAANVGAFVFSIIRLPGF
jgi:hypothetical protein